MKLTRYINQLWLRRRDTDESWYTYLFFAALRVVLVFIPQKGYIHPDEFFQSVEVMTGEPLSSVQVFCLMLVSIR